jgi:hypothetical protein
MVVDKSVIKIFSLGQVKPDDFTIENGIYKMADGARKLLLNELLTSAQYFYFEKKR